MSRPAPDPAPDPAPEEQRVGRGTSALLAGLAIGGLFVAGLVARSDLRTSRLVLSGDVADRTTAVTSLLEADTRSLQQSLTFFAASLSTRASFEPAALHALHDRVARDIPRLPWRAVAAAPLLPVGGNRVAEAFLAREAPAYARLGYPEYRPLRAGDPPDEPIWFAPVLLTEPAAARVDVFGFDMASSASRLATIERALETDRPVLSPPITLSQDGDGDPASLLLIAPVAIDGAEIGMEADEGIAAMSFTPADLLARALEEVGASDWRYLIQVKEGPTPVLSFGSSGGPEAGIALPGPLRVGPEESGFSLFGQQWSVALQPPPGADTIGVASAAFGAIATLFVTGLLMLLVWRTGGERARLEARLVEQARALRESQEVISRSQRAEALGRLTGGVAHDFNNLLSVVSGNLELLLDDLPAEADEARTFVEDALAASEQGARLTQRLLTLGRRASLDPEVLEPDALVGDLESLFRRTIPENISLTFDYGAPAARVRADRAQMQTALLNLVVNARDAMPGGGHIAVRTTTIDAPEGRAHDAVPPGRWVVFEVGDDGLGMDAETLAKATDPFFTTKEAGQGTGLGLSTVMGFARQSDGDLLLASKPGEGTRVRLLLPAADAQATATLEALRKGPGQPLEGRRVLLVEDEEAVRAVIERRLHRWGAETVLSPTGDDAISLLRGGIQVDAVVSDITMPGEASGGDVARVARERGIPAILISGYPLGRSAGPLRAGQSTSAPPGTPHLPKPVSREALLDAFEEILARG